MWAYDEVEGQNTARRATLSLSPTPLQQAVTANDASKKGSNTSDRMTHRMTHIQYLHKPPPGTVIREAAVAFTLLIGRNGADLHPDESLYCSVEHIVRGKKR